MEVINMIAVELLDRVLQFDSSEKGADAVILSVTDAVSQSGMIIDCMYIDGIKVYYEYDKYIKENINNIQNIHVNLITEDEFVIDILHTSHSYIEGVLPRLQQIIDSLYTGDKDPAIIDNLADLTEGITWIFSVGREIVDKYYESKYLKFMLDMDYSGDIQRLEEAFAELKNAIMNMDYILIADILNYEVSDVFNKISTAVQELDSSEDSAINIQN
jgi:hypothetical protein